MFDSSVKGCDSNFEVK